jgi:hypothetical protein
MCDFISWISVNKDGENLLFYLTDKEIFSEEGKKKFLDCRDNDVIGHGAIREFFELGSRGQEHEVRDFWNSDKLPEELAEKVQNFGVHWGKTFRSGFFQADDLEYIIQNGPENWKQKATEQLINQKFTLLKSFEVTVPKDYDHKKQLGTLNPDEFYYFNNNITDKNFCEVTNQLVPGKTYTAKLIRIGSRATSEECLEVYKKNNAILTGAQGLSLVYQIHKEELPRGKYTVSFDEKDALWADASGCHRVPLVDHCSDGDFEFDLGYFGRDWRRNFVVLCLCD